jgi:hypothetical protein
VQQFEQACSYVTEKRKISDVRVSCMLLPYHMLRHLMLKESHTHTCKLINVSADVELYLYHAKRSVM